MITASAALALIVPSAASAAMELNGAAGHHIKTVAVKKHRRVGKGGTRGRSRPATPRPSGSTAATRPGGVLYIYVPIPSVAPTPSVDPNSCQDNGSNCTALGACAYWGLNCESLSPDDQAALQANDLTPANTTASDPSSSDAASSGG
jgi:hypothetical protein